MKKQIAEMKPREIEAHIKGRLLSYFGNVVEDSAIINSSHGAYHLAFVVDGESYAFDFRKKSVPKVLKALRALAAA